MSNAHYTFLPWARQGLATKILEKPDHLGLDAEDSNDLSISSIDVQLEVKGDFLVNNLPLLPPKVETVKKEIHLYGPGDVTAIENRAIIKTEPRAKEQHFEANYLPYIEFYEEDFPWRYTPLSLQGNRLRPWLALVVLKEEEFTYDPVDADQSLPSFSVEDIDLGDIPFPHPYQLWAWAHVHVNATIGTTDTNDAFKKLVQQQPNRACSRIICPRRLEPMTEYVAFLIPAFERGRLAGLGASGDLIQQTDLQRAAWGHAHAYFQKQFPYYYTWKFRTGRAGEDFETLARKIEPKSIHPNVGQRLIGIQAPGYNLSFADGEFPNEGVVLMNGVLKHPDANLPNLLEQETEASQTFVQELADLINLEENLRQEERLAAEHKYATNPFFEDDTDIYDDPIITPPLYGRWHSQQNRVDPEKKEQWVEQLNLDPRNRLAAGFGTEVVRRNQESYMERAWKQFGELFEVNSFLRNAQFKMELNKSVYQKNLEQLPPTSLVRVSANVHTSIRYESGKQSLKWAMVRDRVPEGLFTADYEKVTRPGSALMKRAAYKKDNSRPDRQKAKVHPEINLKDANMHGGMAMEFPLGFENTFLFMQFRDAAQTGLKDPPGWKRNILIHNGIHPGGGVEDFKENLLNLFPFFDKSNWKGYSTGRPKEIKEYRDTIDAKIDPRSGFRRRVTRKLTQFNVQTTQNQVDNFDPILAAPKFNEPTYYELLKLSLDAFVPNLDLVLPNSLGLLKVNRAFLESFLAGLNHEMARELLWREFPTDQRGTYFRHFWNSKLAPGTSPQPDIQPLHEWNTTQELGAHQPEEYLSEQMVLVIRGDLLSRYPYTLIYLQKPNDQGEPKGTKKWPVFEARVKPDLYFLGFDIDEKTVSGGTKENPDWFFVMEERPGEVNFGLDSPTQEQAESQNLDSWNDFNWTHLKVINHHIDLEKSGTPRPSQPDGYHWGKGENATDENPASGTGSAAHMAAILCQQPVRLFFPAIDLLPKTETHE